ncbi:MAG: serine/threonine-protein kinase [Planctomycetaceae bacterium]
MKFTFAPESRPLDGYTIKRAIHRGGFGEVYYALSDAGKEVALKLLNNNLDVELRGVSQCLNLKHPNLVTIFDIRQDSDKDHWIVMEYVGGRGLYEVMTDYPAGMPLPDVLRWLEGITAGLSFLHDRGIVHRDLKPANVFSENGVVKIGDVGLSKYISESRRSAQTQSVGTVYYMAPEVARGRYGREVDVYAIGVMLVEMLTGHVPFDGQTTAEILMKHLTADPDLTPLPVSLRPVIAAALEKDPEKRIADVDRLFQQFREAAGEAASREVAKTLDPASDRVATPNAGPKQRLQSALSRGKNARERSLTGMAETWQPMQRFWNDRVPAPAKWVICGALFLLILESGVLRPVAAGGLVGGIAWMGWRITKRVFGLDNAFDTGEVSRQAAHAGPQYAATMVPNASADASAISGRPAQYADARRPQATVPQPQVAAVRTYTPKTSRQIPARQKTSDITTSMSVAMLAVFLVTVAIHFVSALLPQTVHVVYFGLVTLLAAWTLIIPSKIWEGRTGDGIVRRMLLGGTGLAVGAFAWMLKEFLMLSDDGLLHSGEVGQVYAGRVGGIHLITEGGLPTLAGFMAFFGLLFAIRRWWWQADSFRKARFRVSSALVTLVLGAILTSVLPFPDGLGATWALAISAVVQLSAGWTPQEDRRLIPATESTKTAPVLAAVRHPVCAE